METKADCSDLVIFYSDGHEAHAEPGHPERPARLEAACRALDSLGCWGTSSHVKPLVLPEPVLTGIHTRDYLSLLEAASRQGRRLDGDTYTTPASWTLALNAAGGAAAVAAEVWNGRARTGFALTRPPGHHATPSRGMGFCLLNNIALAAEYLLQVEGARRLAIVDLDLHHGNGTQDAFWRRGEVLFISTHQSPLYPGTGMISERGAGSGLGANANIPLPPLSGDSAFQAAMGEVILPLLDRHGPEMLLVSVGFDPHWRDPLGHLLLSAGVFAGLISSLEGWASQHAKGRIALILEGGYDLEAGMACVAGAGSALLHQEWQDPLGVSPQSEGTEWRAVVQRAKQVFELE